MSQVSTTARNRRLSNSRPVILGVLVLGAVTGFLVLRQVRVRDNRAMLLREAKARLDRKQVDLALSYLNRYLEFNPGDTAALDLKAKVLSLGVKNAYQALEAIQVHNQVLARDPEGPGRQDTRRRLVELTLKVGGRSQTAVALAHDLIKRGADNAGAHRLLALGLEQLGEEGDAKALAEACKEYETAQRKEPDDIAGAERLALLYRDKLNDPRKALRVLDDLVAASRDAPERLAQAHLVRSRLFAGLGQREKPADAVRLATIEALKAGDARRAELLAAQVVQDDPQGLDARVWQARSLSTLGKPGEAEKMLRLLIEQQPEEPGPWLQLLMFQVGRKQAREAAATVAQIRRKVMTDRPELLWAQCYRAIGDAEQADACYKQALRRWPEDLAVSRSAIDFYEQAGRGEDAEAVLWQVLGRDPAPGWAGRKLALSLSRHVNDRAAWREALRLIGPTARPDDLPDDRLARAQVYARGPEPGHRQQAILMLEELASETPGATAVHDLLARLRLASGQVDRARQHAARAAGEGACPDAILLYASILLRARDLDGAERQLDRLVAIDPDGLPVAEMRARILTARRRGEEGAAVLEKAFASRVNTSEGLEVGEKIFLLLTELKQPDAAERVARRLGALGPRGACILAEYLAGRGHLDEAARQLQDAARAGDLRHAGRSALALAFLPDSDPRWLKLADQYLAEALKQQPGSAELLQEQAYVRRLRSRPEDQVKIYEAILARKPAGFMFLNDMAWTLSEDLHRPEEALRRADEALEHVGREPDLLDTRGVILTRLGKLDEAIKDLESAASAMPSGPVYYHLAKAYRKQGRGDESRKARDRAKQAGLRPEQLQPSDRGEWDDIMTQ